MTFLFTYFKYEFFIAMFKSCFYHARHLKHCLNHFEDFNKQIESLSLKSVKVEDVCVSRPPALCWAPGPRLWPPICIYRPWSPPCVYLKFVFTDSARGLSLHIPTLFHQFVFTGPGLRFVRTQADPSISQIHFMKSYQVSKKSSRRSFNCCGQSTLSLIRTPCIILT